MEIFKNFDQMLARLIRIIKNLPCFTSLIESGDGVELSEETDDGPEDIVKILRSWHQVEMKMNPSARVVGQLSDWQAT